MNLFHRLDKSGSLTVHAQDKKKPPNVYLLSALVETEIKMNKLPFAKGLSFAPEEMLFERLHLKPGSVTPFGLLFDTQALGGSAPTVQYWLDENATERQYLMFHPCACHASVATRTSDFIEFIEKVTGAYVLTAAGC